MPLQNKALQVCAQSHTGHTAFYMLIFAFSGIAALFAVQPQPAHADGLSIGYGSGQGVVSGMTVSVDQEDASTVVPANTSNADYVVGIAIDQEASAVVFDDNDAVFVSAEGTVEALVSTQGGDISEGDLIVVSSISGIGTKKKTGAEGQKIIGVAKQDFNASSPGAEAKTLENAGEVSIGRIDIKVLVGESATDQVNSDDVNVLVRIGRRIAGRPVSVGQVVVTAVIVIISFLVSGALLFGAIKGSFTSLGRNPLSAKTIYRGMLRASAIALGVMAIGVVAGYVVLIV